MNAADDRRDVEDRLLYPLASAAEESQLAEMRAALQDELALLRCRHWPDVTGDLRMLRFLRGFDHSVPQAVAAVRDMLATRAKYDLDALHDRWAHASCHHIEGDFPHQAAVMRWKPGIPTCGLSSDGHPIAYEPLRFHDYGKMLEEIGEECMLEFYLAQCESRMGQVQRLSEEQGRMVKIVLVIDMAAVSLWPLLNRRWAKYDERHQRAINRSLAELLARVYVINCPSWVVSFYRRMRWWVPANTQRKIRLLGTDCREELCRVMDESVLDAMLSYAGGRGAGIGGGGGDGGGKGAGSGGANGDAAALKGERNELAAAEAAPASPERTGRAEDGAATSWPAALVDVGLARASPRTLPAGSSPRVRVEVEVEC